MALRILHVLSSNFYAGSTAYAVSLSHKQIADSNVVYIITDKVCVSGMFSYVALPVSKRSWLQRIKNVRFIRKFIIQNQIDIVHAHSRAASWICYYAVKRTQVPLVSTIHGRQVIHSFRKNHDIFGERIIGICPNLITHLKKELHIVPEKLVFIPNGFNMEIFQQPIEIQNDDKITLSYIGRFNGVKGTINASLITDVFPALLHENPTLFIKLYGGEWDSLPEKGKDAFEELHVKYGERIEHAGFLPNIHPVLLNSDLVIGAGRVAVEGLLYHKPVFAIGEAYNHGLIRLSNIDQAISSNFGDILSVQTSFSPNTREILDEIRYFLNHRDEFKVNLSHYLDIYNFNSVYPQIMQVYRSALIQKVYHGTIPILMYHKIPDRSPESKHRIFVVKNKFKKHLQFFKFRGLTSITFKDYQAFTSGDKPIREFPKKPFILTFDDGYEDNYRNMLPLTKKYGFKGVLFLLGDFTIENNRWDPGEDPLLNRLMSIDQKKEFVASGWEIGAHTITHCDLTRLSKNQAKLEIERSKIYLEEQLQTNIISFAYPFGLYNDELKGLVRKSGYEFGILTDTGGISIEDDRYAIFRVSIFPEENLFQLYKKTSSWYRTYYKHRRGH